MARRYIDANALTDEVIKSKKYNPHMDEIVRRNHNHEHDKFLKMIDEATTVANVEEVKYGEWVWELQGIGKMNCKCTNCQEWFPVNYEDLDEYGRSERETKRCPNCGAIMRGGFNDL